jgi:alpha-D-ribose 1-methylphosphonate 5-triphosphate diphosphatase PhnM
MRRFFQLLFLIGLALFLIEQVLSFIFYASERELKKTELRLITLLVHFPDDSQFENRNRYFERKQKNPFQETKHL